MTPITDEYEHTYAEQEALAYEEYLNLLTSPGDFQEFWDELQHMTCFEQLTKLAFAKDGCEIGRIVLKKFDEWCEAKSWELI